MCDVVLCIEMTVISSGRMMKMMKSNLPRETSKKSMYGEIASGCERGVLAVFAGVEDEVEYHLEPHGEYVDLEYLGRHKTSPEHQKQESWSEQGL